MAAPVLSSEPRGFGWREWWPLLAGPLLWSVAELASLWIVENGCTAGFRDAAPPDALRLSLLVLLVGAVCLAGTAHAFLVAWRRWDRALDHDARGRLYGDRKQFTALAGVIGTAAFGVAILYHAATALLFSGCTRVFA